MYELTVAHASRAGVELGLVAVPFRGSGVADVVVALMAAAATTCREAQMPTIVETSTIVMSLAQKE